MTEIAWRPWSEDVFVQAQTENKPVLLSLTAVWCQFCKRMDEETYGNEAIAQYIGDNFVPVRVDSDKRPDVNARYAQGGWPSTCVLTPEGDILWGGTFVPADQMGQLLPQVLNEFHNNKPAVAQHVANLREQIRQQNSPPPLNTSLQVTQDAVVGILLAVMHNFDFAFGGFGHNGQKFPHADAVEFAMEQYAKTTRTDAPNNKIMLMVSESLFAMDNGGLHDKDGVGGFFRYTQTPDWREPQVEKLLEDSAVLTRIYARAFQVLGDDRWKETALQTLKFLDETLYDHQNGTWGNSQAADSDYYAQPLAERAEWTPPTVDPTVYAGPNAQAVRAHVAYWQATGDTDVLQKATKGMDFVLKNLLQADGALNHFVPQNAEDAASAGRMATGLLADSARVCSACLDLYEAGQGVDYLDRADEIATWVRGHLEDPRAGGLFDGVVRPDAVGNLKVGTKDVPDNMLMTDALLRLFLATGDEDHARLAQRNLQTFLPAAPQLGFFGAGYALAAERALLAPILVHVVGATGSSQTQALLQAAHAPYRFERVVQPLDPENEDDREHIESLGYPVTGEPQAYVCVATNCLPPTSDPAALTELVKTAQ